AFVERPHAPVAELAMTCDTLWIDTDRAICTMTWRARFALNERDQPGRVVIGMELHGHPLTWADLMRGPPERSAVMQTQPGTLTPSAVDGREWPAWLASRGGHNERRQPRGSGSPAESAPPPRTTWRRLDAGTMDVQLSPELKSVIDAKLETPDKRARA